MRDSPPLLLRTMLFAPGDDRRKCARAVSSAADAVIYDLEDGVAPNAKDTARELVAALLATKAPGPMVVARINSPASPAGERDLAALSEVPVQAVVVPKAEAAVVELLAGTGLSVIALIETAAGVLDAYRLAELESVSMLMFGPVDLAAEIGCEPSVGGQELLFARSQIVIASAAAGLPAPIDGPCLSVADLDLLRVEAHHARGLGFGGKACIHPRQLDEVRRVFSPSPEQVEWATRVAAAYEEASERSVGVATVDAEMVDLPVARRAYAILERSKEVK